MRQTKKIATTRAKRTVSANKGAAGVGPGKEDVVGAMHKYCEEDANEAGDGEKRGWMIGKAMPMRTMTGWIRGGLQVIVVVAHAPLGRRGSYSSPVFKSVSPTSSSTSGLVTPALLGSELVHLAEPDHILRIVVSIAGHQRASDADDAGKAHTMTFGGTSASSI